MSFIFAGLLAIALLLFPGLDRSAIAAPAALTLGALPGLEGVFAGETPDLGLQDGQFAPCPDQPNCVVSQGADEAHQIDPIPYNRDRAAAHDLLVKVLGVVPRTEIVAQTDDYIRAKATSRLMGFVDDLEFYFPKEESVIHLRSAARLGESDLGVNRRRLEQIRLALQDLGV
jgi:uncharacterized protein (DUF1499 family)